LADRAVVHVDGDGEVGHANVRRRTHAQQHCQPVGVTQGGEDRCPVADGLSVWQDGQGLAYGVLVEHAAMPAGSWNKVHGFSVAFSREKRVRPDACTTAQMK
jgi:hypothetical protein